MRIGRVETFLLPPRFLLCRIETEDGVVGWGEPIVEGRAETVRAAVETCAEHLVGADPLRIEDHWQHLSKASFYRGGPILSSAVAGVDQALWDIAGQVYGAPVHDLLGGPVRDRARVYAWLHGKTPDDLADAARERTAAGYTAVKLAPASILGPIATPAAISAVVDRVAVVRETVGDDVDVLVDLHGRASFADARRLMAGLEPLRPLFVEEPLRPDVSGRLALLARDTSIPLATGERLYGRGEFRDVLDEGVAVVQADVSHAGGISEVRRIAALAEIWDAHLAPHCPHGPISLAASLQVDFATPNFLIQEQSIDIHRGTGAALDWLVDTSVLKPDAGFVPRPRGPGLGIEVDEKGVREASASGHRFRSPTWRAVDGSFAEW